MTNGKNSIDLVLTVAGPDGKPVPVTLTLTAPPGVTIAAAPAPAPAPVFLGGPAFGLWSGAGVAYARTAPPTVVFDN